ncbi:MAG TPA: DUF5781 family protein [archaeon]|nr:DUF5781 family protein [archaeon]
MATNSVSVVEKAANQALELMRDAGYGIDERIELSVDESLPYMGYAMRKGNGHRLVISGSAVKSPMLPGLLLHELSHVRRNIEKHPSHDNALLDSIIAHIAVRHGVSQNAMQGIHMAINNIQDIYADDIVFRVLKRSPVVPLSVLTAFFRDWIADSPSLSKGKKNMRENASILLRNSFALSNMERHGLKDGKAQEKAGVFLKRSGLSEKDFAYFRKFMKGLDETVTAKQFEKELEAYLGRLLEIIGE